MGCEGSVSQGAREEYTYSRVIDKDLEQDRHHEPQKLKLLLLGCKGSGRNTLCKQLDLCFGAKSLRNGKATLSLIEGIHQHMMRTMQSCVEQCCAHQLSPNGQNALNDWLVIDIDSTTKLNQRSAAILDALWHEDAIQHIATTANSESESTLNMSHFFRHIDRIADDGYVPSDEDILLHSSRGRTKIQEYSVDVHGWTFEIVNLCDQLQHSKLGKYIHYFENADAIVFVAASSWYEHHMVEQRKIALVHGFIGLSFDAHRIPDALLHVIAIYLDVEDLQNNGSMGQQLELFDKVMNDVHLKRLAPILLLNKVDVLKQKLDKSPIDTNHSLFKDFRGDPQSFEDVVNHVRGLFESRFQDVHRGLFVHLITMTDAYGFEKTWNDIQNILISHKLQQCGLI